MANLAALLDQEASAEIEAILSEAKQRASEIVAEAREKADAHLAQKARATQVQHEAALVRARSAAQLEASSIKLRAQYQAVEGVFAEAERRALALTQDSARYPEVFEKLLQEATEALGGAEVAQITVAERDRALAESLVKKHGLASAVVTDDALVGGVRVKAKNANVNVENSLPDRLARARQSMAGEVAQLLGATGASVGTASQGSGGAGGKAAPEASAKADKAGATQADTAKTDAPKADAPKADAPKAKTPEADVPDADRAKPPVRAPKLR